MHFRRHCGIVLYSLVLVCTLALDSQGLAGAGPVCVDSPRGSVPFGSKAYSPDGNHFAREVEPKDQGKVGIFDQKTGERLRVIQILREGPGSPEEVDNPLKGLCWSPDSKWVAVMYHHEGPSGYIGAVNAKTGQERARVNIKKWYHRMEFSPDGKVILAGGDKLPLPLP